ncbi:hypothetical protein HMN09_00794300 [Mycena chlorophos]|uniref:ARM repeat-containing protein n=1 Tax=Mycena chlorophos TaxID=658473 RepID=A0A8H6SU49_MYCCL|nr:hypothetical protein HMN09_00794300 [Mycena chlorophos]
MLSSSTASLFSGSRTSVRTWWSDAAPLGATVSLHSVAKPLMRLQYHREAQKFLQRQQDVDLSEESMKVLASYLVYKYVGPKTKELILGELAKRAVPGSKDASVIFEAIGPDPMLMDQFVHVSILQGKAGSLTPEPEPGNVMSDTPSRTDVRSLVTLREPRWMAFLFFGTGNRDPLANAPAFGLDADLSLSACKVLTRICATPAGAHAVISSGILRRIPELVQSADLDVRCLGCQMLRQIAASRVLTIAMVDEDIPALLLSLARQGCETTRAHVLFALSRIAFWKEGADAVVAAGTPEFCRQILRQMGLGYFERLVTDSDVDEAILQSLCSLMGNLVAHDHLSSTVSRVVAPRQLAQFSSFGKLAPYLVFALAKYSLNDVYNAQSILEDGREDLVQLLRCAAGRPGQVNTELRMWACELLGNLASHVFLIPILLTLPVEPIRFLVSALSHPSTVSRASQALIRFRATHEGQEHISRIAPMLDLSSVSEWYSSILKDTLLSQRAE